MLVSEYVANFKTLTRSTLPRVDSFPIQEGSFGAIYQYTATFYCMTFNLYYIKFNFSMNPTYKSALKALNRANFGLNAGLLSRAQQAKQRACRRRRPALRGAANCTASNQNKRQHFLLYIIRNSEFELLTTCYCVLLYWRHIPARLLYNDFDYTF